MEEIKYQGKYITVVEEEIDGHVYERARLREGVHVIPHDGNGNILLIREYRVHEKGERWKFVSGWMDKEGKDALTHAQEELAEEIGYRAEVWKEIFREKNRLGTCSFGIHVFLCEDLVPLEEKPENPDTGEVRELRWVDRRELVEILKKGDLKEAVPYLAALVFLLDWEEKNVIR